MNKTLKHTVIFCLLIGLATSSYAAQDHETANNTDKGHQEHQHPSTQQHNEHDEDEKHTEQHGEDESAEAHNDADSHEHGAHESDDDKGIKLSSEQRTLANIKITSLKPRPMDYKVYAPGEIKANGYTSYLVSPRVDSVVLRRHVALGDHVKKGQSLVTLFSETVAEAQASLRVAASEWRRVKKLGRKAVGDKRFVSAQTDFEAAYGRLLAFGLSEKAIQPLMRKSQALGEYTLIAENGGAVMSDDFHQGQRVESGQALMELADEKALWVEARLAPTDQLELPAGTRAQIKVGNEWFTAIVAQEAHTIDPQTRTRVVRLQVNNDAHRLHPGLFADVYFSFISKEPVLAVPESALMRSSDGDWTIFVEQAAGQFNAQEIELGRSLGKWREIRGIEAGTRVVSEGAFFVASEIAKGGFDPHNH